MTGRISAIEAPVGRSVRFGTLEITARICHTRPPEETPETTVFLDVFDIKPGEPPARLFSGWMFASSPALNALEHPVYDIWVIDCKIISPRPVLRHGREVARGAERIGEAAAIVRAPHLDGAEAGQVLGHELCVEHPVAAVFKPGDKMHQGDFCWRRSRS